ncbi:MAG: SDR family oxidoreductase [Thermodesulfobacteriota bacterium]
MQSLRGKVVVVTGAASGIGRALSLILAGEGCCLAIADMNEEGLRETAAMAEKRGAAAMTCRLDVSAAEDVRGFAAGVVEKFGRVDIVINNAGITTVGVVDETNHDGFKRVMEVNFWGVYNGVIAFLPYLRRQNAGRIVNISSVFGLWGIPTQAAYNCSKFAVRGLSESLAQELAGTGVGVSCVYPGGIKTNIARSARFQQSYGPLEDKEAFTKLFERLALTTPEKAAAVIVKGIKSGRARILIGPDAYAMDVTQRLFPTLYQKIIPAVLKLRLITIPRPLK